MQTLRRALLLIVVSLWAAPLSAQTAFVFGTVFSDGGQTLANMNVSAYTLSGAEAGTTVTDGQGRYTLALAPGSYRLLAYDNSGLYATTYYPNARSFETSAQIALTADQRLSNINFLLVRGVRVSGRVQSSSNLQPLAGAVVAAYNLDGTRRGHTRTNSTGNYSLVLPPGEYKLVAYEDDFSRGAVHVPQFYSGQSSFETSFPVVATIDRPGINFVLDPGTTVFGRVTDEKTGTPVAGAVIAAYNSLGAFRYSTTTNAQGEYRFALPPGTYKFAAFDPERKYAISYYRDASNFGAAATINIVVPQNLAPFDFSLREAEEQSHTTLYIPGVANTPGLNDTFFQTDLWIHNPSTSGPVAVMLTYLLEGQDNSSRAGVTVTVGPRQQLYIRNVLQQLFGAAGKGGLRLEADREFTVVSRTYNNPPNSAQVGTYGMSIPGLTIGDSVGRGVISGLAQNVGYRSNVGVLNPQSQSINVTFTLFSADGLQLGETVRTFRPLEFFQTNIFSFLNVGMVTDNAYLVVSSQEGSFFAYGSVVDQKSGDGMFILARR